MRLIAGQNEFGDPWLVFNLILFSTCSQSFKQIGMWEGLGAHFQRSDVITSYNLRDSDVLVLFDEALWESGKQSFRKSRWPDRMTLPEGLGTIPTEVKRFFLCLVWFPVSLY